ncbi:MAG: ribokinase [Chloroflexi bacterium]|nr:ribokinase [Chloroflexota bacterium]
MKGSKPRVTVVGSFAVGLTLRAPRFPVKGETLIGSDFDMGPGGKGSNQAVGAARLGAESHLVAVIGADIFGDVGVNLYKQEGVGIEHLRRTAERNTGVGFITLNAEGDNHIVLDMGANHLLSPDDVDKAEDLIASSDVVLSVLEIAPATAARGMALARKHGALSILNPAPAQPLDDSLLSQVDVLTPNESELRILCGLAPDDAADTLELAHRLQKRGVRNLVVTRGGDGALVIAEDGTVTHVPGQKVNVVDTTGAGDAFTCALGVAQAEGKPLLEAVRFATFAGALACAKLGVIPALPYRKDIDALMKQERFTTKTQ